MLTPEQIEALCTGSRSNFEALKSFIRSQGSALVAFSAGVDSTLVLKVAVDELKSGAVALTAVSASMPQREQAEAEALALQLGAAHCAVRSEEVSRPDYAKNAFDRCYFCKSELYAICESKRSEMGLAVILDGFNADDLSDHRPGHQAARERRVLSPLAQVGLHKDEIRAWSQRLGLPTWDKPQMACLASRIPYGTPVNEQRLAQIGAAEAELWALGLRSFRLRYHGDVARIEVSADEYDSFLSAEFRARVNRAVLAHGFRFVALDLEPFRSGRMNEAAGLKSPPAPGALPVLRS